MIGGIDDGTVTELADVLEDGEEILGAISSFSAALILSDRRLLFARAGGIARRPVFGAGRSTGLS
jgi:hypothetical protein